MIMMQIKSCFYVQHIERNLKLCAFFVSDVEKRYVKAVKEHVGENYNIYKFELRAYYDTIKDKLKCFLYYIIDDTMAIKINRRFSKDLKEEIRRRVLKEIK